MNKKGMNKKGFTLVELLATIIILGLLTTVTITTVTSYYGKSKTKSEEAFRKQLTKTIESYITLNGSSKTYTSKGTYYKCHASGDGTKCDATSLSEATTTLGAVKGDNLTNNNNFTNPGNDQECLDDTSITIYRDSDYVYCFVAKFDCLTEDKDSDPKITKEISTCENLYYTDNTGEDRKKVSFLSE